MFKIRPSKGESQGLFQVFIHILMWISRGKGESWALGVEALGVEVLGRT
jgi:hypothetical protein